MNGVNDADPRAEWACARIPTLRVGMKLHPPPEGDPIGETRA